MSPREFCRLEGFHSTLITSFSFDPLFFERLALPELWASGSSNILVCADAREVQQSVASWPGQVMHLGRRYQLAPILSQGAFHPKMILKAGRDGGAVWVGSANVTFSGWSVNRELGTSWRIGTDQQDTGTWLAPVLQALLERGASEDGADVIQHILNQGWMNATGVSENDTASPVLSTFGGQTLGFQIGRRWAGRRFDHALVCTGSTDVGGRFLAWLNETFGVQRATVLTDPGRCAFDLDRLRDLPIEVDVRSVASEVPRPMHAKLVWLDGPDGPAACFGSANCSSAAWLAPLTRGGNDELIVVYDAPDPTEFAPTLDLFDGASAPLEPKVATLKALADPTSSRQYRILHSGWDPDTGGLMVQLSAPLQSTVVAVLRVGAHEFVCRPSPDQPSLLQAEVLLTHEAVGSIFASLRLESPGGLDEQHLLWINHCGDLRHALRGRGIAHNLDGLLRAPTNSERLKYLKALHQLSSELLSNPDAFSDPRYLLPQSTKDKKPADAEPPAQPINPAELIQSLAGIRDIQRKQGPGLSGVSPTLSLTGVWRLLFQSALEQELDEEMLELDDTDDSDGDQKSKRKDSRKAAKTRLQSAGAEAPDERLKARLAAHVENLIAGLEHTLFAEEATATQLVQALAYVLTVSVAARRDGWATEEQSEEWARHVLDVALTKPCNSHSGLIECVQSRYAEHRNEDAFKRIVGDGTLWAALLAVLTALKWRGAGGFMEHALLIRQIFRSQSLIASSSAGKLNYLVSNDQLLQLEKALEIAPEVDALLTKLESRLSEITAVRGQPEDNAPDVYEEGDLMWRQVQGWAICRATAHRGSQFVVAYLQKKGKTANLSFGWYWNVSMIEQSDAEVSDCLQQLRSLVV